jgi:hypothetical protein
MDVPGHSTEVAFLASFFAVATILTLFGHSSLHLRLFGSFNLPF